MNIKQFRYDLWFKVFTDELIHCSFSESIEEANYALEFFDDDNNKGVKETKKLLNLKEDK